MSATAGRQIRIGQVIDGRGDGRGDGRSVSYGGRIAESPRGESLRDPDRDAENAFCRSLEAAAIELLRDEVPFPHFFREVTVTAEASRFVLNGQVPTYYLKSILQNRLQRAFPRMTIDNRVAVINSYGLSSFPG